MTAAAFEHFPAHVAKGTQVAESPNSIPYIRNALISNRANAASQSARDYAATSATKDFGVT